MFPEKALQDGVLAELAGYFVLDALVGNTDRHHENWGIVSRSVQAERILEITMRVAPTFDHASSLGRELLDEARTNMVAQGRVGNYVRRGHGAIFQHTADRRGLNPIAFVELGVRAFPDYFVPPLQRLKGVPLQLLQDTAGDVPLVRMTQPSKDFVRAFMAYTYQALISLTP